MSWFEKLLPGIATRHVGGSSKKTVPEGLWSKCPNCEALQMLRFALRAVIIIA